MPHVNLTTWSYHTHTANTSSFLAAASLKMDDAAEILDGTSSSILNSNLCPFQDGEDAEEKVTF